MIGLLDCHFSFRGSLEPRVILSGATLVMRPKERVSILAVSGSGKTTIMRMLAGLIEPQRGRVLRDDGLPWVLGSAGMLHPAMTGEENVRVLANLVDQDPDWVSAYAKIFSGLGADYYEPVRGYSSGMKARLGMALSFSLPVTTYLADDTLGSGDQAFRMKCEAALERQLDHAGLLLLTRSSRAAEQFGERFGILRYGRIVMCQDFDEANSLFESDQQDDFAEYEELVESFHAF